MKEREIFLSKMVEVGFLHPSEAPTPDAERAFPPSVPLPLSEVREKTVVIFHDESTFQKIHETNEEGRCDRQDQVSDGRGVESSLGF